MTDSVQTPSPLRELLACPQCRGELTDADQQLVCHNCQLAYPVEDGIPHLLQEAAIQLQS